MAQRHQLEAGSWQSVFRRLEELVLANSGEDEFQEIFRILIAKLYLETFEPSSTLNAGAPDETVTRVKGVLSKADRTWPQTLIEGIEPKLSPDHLQVCVEVIDGLSLRETSFEVMDALFEYLISKSAKGAKGQYFTPRHVAEAMVRIVHPRVHEMVCDPACGSSGFLIHALQFAGDRLDSAAFTNYCKSKVWGFDIDQRAIQVANALMVIAGDGSSNIYRLNSLLTPNAGFELFEKNIVGATGVVSIEDVARSRIKNWRGFDCIITNPPFAGEVREPALLESYKLARAGKRNERDVLFIERSIRLLRPGGRLAIVVPNNKVSGSQFSYAREWLTRNARVVGVLSLGRDTFKPHTSQKAEVIFAVKREKPLALGHNPDENILFMTSERDGKDSKGKVISRVGKSIADTLWDRADHDLDDAVAAFREFVSEEGIEWGDR